MATIQDRSSESSSELAVAVRQHVDKGDFEVPLLPEVARKVIELLQTPDADAVRLARLIQGDQTLAGHVMRVANSAAYSPSSTIVSLQQAIARLGINLIGEIALAASVNGKLFNVACYETHIKKIWQHALATALWSKEISRMCRKNVEASFLCGLLHSIGRPVVLQLIVDTAKELHCSPSHELVLKLENEHHREVGCNVIQCWKMPALVTEAVNYFNHYDAAPQYGELAATITAASQLSTYQLYPDSGNEESLKTLPALTFLNLYQDDIEKLLALNDSVQKHMESFGL